MTLEDNIVNRNRSFILFSLSVSVWHIYSMVLDKNRISTFGMLSNLLFKGFRSYRELSTLIRKLSRNCLKNSVTLSSRTSSASEIEGGTVIHWYRIPRRFLHGLSWFFRDPASAGNLRDYAFLVEGERRYAACDKKTRVTVATDVSSPLPEIRGGERGTVKMEIGSSPSPSSLFVVLGSVSLKCVTAALRFMSGNPTI